jgi:class 3 adenylate cyclase
VASPSARVHCLGPIRYTPKHLAEKILTSRSALEGEQKQVTVLFADVKGSMDLSEQVDPEAGGQRLPNRAVSPPRTFGDSGNR